MISIFTITIYIILAITVFVVQMLLCKKTKKKVVWLIPFFVLISALAVAFIMSLVNINDGSVKCGTLSPIVQIIKDGVTVTMVADAAAMVISKFKGK